VADTTMISALQPALVLLVAGRLFGERITWREIVLTIVSLFGIALVTIGSSGTPVWSLKGDLFAFASVLAWTAYFLASKRARSSVPALDYITVVMIAAAIVITPVALLSGQPLGGLNGLDYVFLALFVIGATVGHLLVTWAHAHVDVTVSSLLMLGLPVMSPVAALIILGEPLAPLSIVGGIVVVGSLAAIAARAARIGGGEELPPTEAPQV
jgi:drug/metabolite transporter (DMT)-like permease